MSIIMTLLLMVFLHIVDDYYLQGILAKMKQQSWWKQNAPDDKYRFDYIVALFFHSFSWAFVTMLPVFAISGWQPRHYVLILFILNIIIHGVVDNLKCNKLQINLIIDQSIHIAQIFITWGLCVLLPHLLCV